MTTDEFLESALQQSAESDDAPGVVKGLKRKATNEDMPLLEYIAETGPEIREILDRMFKSEVYYQAKKRGLAQ